RTAKRKPAAKAKREVEASQSSGSEESGSHAPIKAKLAAPRRGARVFTAVGVLSAALIAVSLNLLVNRFYKRWDWTSSGLYTLSQPTLDTLHGLDQPIDVIVFLSRSDNMRVSVEHMLTAYGA